MYESFRVKNFRCFKDLQINDLGRVNLIAGKNNTGKTALMEAMYLLTRPLKPQVLFDLQNIRGLELPDQSLHVYWSQLFFGGNTSDDIEMEVDRLDSSEHRKLRIVELDKAKRNRRAFENYQQFLISEALVEPIEAFKLLEAVDALLRLSFAQGTVEKGVAYFASPPNVPAVSTAYADQPSYFMPAQGRPPKDTVMRNFSLIDSDGRLSNFVSLMQKLEPRLTDIRLTEPYGETIMSGRVNGRLIPLPLMGEGLNRVAHLALTMMSDAYLFIFVDEVENGIHYSAQTDIWKAINELSDAMDIQVFATTHSLEMVRAAYKAFEEESRLKDFRYHRLDRNTETGDIEAVTYNEFAIKAAMSTNWEIR